MDLVLGLAVGSVIYFCFRGLESKFSLLNLTTLELVHARANLKSITASILVPFIISLVFGLLYETKIPSTYTIPGLIASLVIVWPFLRNPQSVPEQTRMAKQRSFAVYLFFVMSIALFSYIGGYIGSKGLTLNQLSAGTIIDDFWIVLFGAFLSQLALRFLNLGTPAPQKADTTLSPDDTKPLET